MKRNILFGVFALLLILLFFGCMSIVEDKYYVIFHLDGGNINGHPGSVVVRDISSGKPVNTSSYDNFPKDPKKEECTFGGWFTARNGFGNKVTGQTKIYSDLTVYAKWIVED